MLQTKGKMFNNDRDASLICFGIPQRLYAKFEVLYALFVWPTV